LSFNPFNEWILATASGDATIKLFDLRKLLRSLHTFDSHEYVFFYFSPCALVPDSYTVVKCILAILLNAHILFVYLFVLSCYGDSISDTV
jgi:WD40 repeat protein